MISSAKGSHFVQASNVFSQNSNMIYLLHREELQKEARQLRKELAMMKEREKKAQKQEEEEEETTEAAGNSNARASLCLKSYIWPLTCWFFFRKHQHISRLFAHNSNSMKDCYCRTSGTVHHIATNFCSCHDSCAVMPCAKFCSNRYILEENTIQFQSNLNFDGKKIICDMGPMLIK